MSNQPQPDTTDEKKGIEGNTLPATFGRELPEEDTRIAVVARRFSPGYKDSPVKSDPDVYRLECDLTGKCFHVTEGCIVYHLENPYIMRRTLHPSVIVDGCRGVAEYVRETASDARYQAKDNLEVAVVLEAGLERGVEVEHIDSAL